jgi:hypothetical protein
VAPRIVARVLLTIGFLAASVAYSSWIAERTIFDPAATRGATNALLTTPTVHDMLAREIRTALQSSLGPKVDNAKLTAAIDRAVDDPQFVGAFENAIVSVNQAALSGGQGRVTLDTGAVTASVNNAVARYYPAIAPQVKKSRAVAVPIGSATLPHIGNAQRSVREMGDIALALAVLLIGAGLALAPERKTFRRAGRRIAFLAIGPVLVFVVGPHVLASAHNRALSVGGVLLTAYGHRVLFSAGVLAVVGISTWLIAIALPKRAATGAGTEPAGPPLQPVYVRRTTPRVPAEPAGVPETLYL